MGTHPVPSVAEAVAKVKKQKKDSKEKKEARENRRRDKEKKARDKKEKKKERKAKKERRNAKFASSSARKIMLSIQCVVPGQTIPTQGICVKDNVILGSVLNAWATGLLGCDLPKDACVFSSLSNNALDVRQPLHLLRNKLPVRGGRLMVSVSMETKRWDTLCKFKEDAIKAEEQKAKGKGGGGPIPQARNKKVKTVPMRPHKERIGLDLIEANLIEGDAECVQAAENPWVDEVAAAAALEELLS